MGTNASADDVIIYSGVNVNGNTENGCRRWCRNKLQVSFGEVKSKKITQPLMDIFFGPVNNTKQLKGFSFSLANGQISNF